MTMNVLFLVLGPLPSTFCLLEPMGKGALQVPNEVMQDVSRTDCSLQAYPNRPNPKGGVTTNADPLASNSQEDWKRSKSVLYLEFRFFQ